MHSKPSDMQHFDRVAYKERKAVKQAAKEAGHKALEESRAKAVELRKKDAEKEAAAPEPKLEKPAEEVDLEPKDEEPAVKEEE